MNISPLIRAYYKFKGFKWPNTWQAMAFAHTEMAEAYELLLADGDFVRNNPDDKEDYSPTRLESELADAIMMLQVAGMHRGLDPIGRLFKRLMEGPNERK